MGCCQINQVKDKDEPLLQEHSVGIDKFNATSSSIQSTEIKNGKNADDKNNDKMMIKDEPKRKERNIMANNSKLVVKPNEIKENVEYIAPNKGDSRLNQKDIMKLENFTKKKMNETKEGTVINLKIKSMDTKFPIFTVSINEELSVLDLKNKIYQESPDQIVALRQRLIHKGRLLKDVRTLKQYNICSDHTVMLVRSRRKQTNAPNSITSLNRHNKKNKSSRYRAMTLNIEPPQQIYRRSKTPELQ